MTTSSLCEGSDVNEIILSVRREPAEDVGEPVIKFSAPPVYCYLKMASVSAVPLPGTIKIDERLLRARGELSKNGERNIRHKLSTQVVPNACMEKINK